ncbi:MAG: hypothetical protein LW808_002060 [Verrucomicrobiota bacterium]|nr:MAG: hypothetical protein LW808_002060 [Verrucomicrobiota bacterium]
MDFRIAVGPRGFTVTQGEEKIGDISAKEVAKSLITNKELKGKRPGPFARIKQGIKSFIISRLLKKADKVGLSGLSQKERDKIDNIGNIVLAYVKAGGFDFRKRKDCFETE